MAIYSGFSHEKWWRVGPIKTQHQTPLRRLQVVPGQVGRRVEISAAFRCKPTVARDHM